MTARQQQRGRKETTMNHLSPDEQRALGLPDPNTYREPEYRLPVTQPEPMDALAGEVVPLPYLRYTYRTFDRVQMAQGERRWWVWVERS